MKKLIRITTVPISLKVLLRGQLRYMSQYFEVIGISSPASEMIDVEKDEGIPTVEVSMSRQITPLRDLMALFRMYRILKREKPDIVHSHTPKAGIIGMVAAKLARVPVRLHTVAGLPLMEAKGFKRKLLNAVEKMTYKAATKIYPNSNGLLEFIVQENLCDPGKIKVISSGSSNGIDTSFFSCTHFHGQQREDLRKSLKISFDDFVFIAVGRMVKDKGINELVKAFSELDKKNVKLLLVGSFEHDLDPLLQVTLDTINSNPNIISVGFQPEVRPYFAIAHALVFPSYREGFPNVVMQAGAMDLPSIVTDINGCNEIIVSEHNGLIIPVKDDKAILKSMSRLMEDPRLYSYMMQNSRRMITERYEQSVVWKALLEEYRKILN